MEIDRDTVEALRCNAVEAARRAGAPVADLDDIAQEALVRLLLQNRPPDKPRGWIRTVARNLAIDAHRDQPPQGWAEMPMSAPSPGHAVWPSEFRERSASLLARADLALGSVVDRMSDVLTDAELRLILDAVQGMPVREIAERHGYTEKSARQKISVARKKLRAAFPDRDLDF